MKSWSESAYSRSLDILEQQQQQLRNDSYRKVRSDPTNLDTSSPASTRSTGTTSVSSIACHEKANAVSCAASGTGGGVPAVGGEQDDHLKPMLSPCASTSALSGPSSAASSPSSLARLRVGLQEVEGSKVGAVNVGNGLELPGGPKVVAGASPKPRIPDLNMAKVTK